jgi:hypothetical protein
MAKEHELDDVIMEEIERGLDDLLIKVEEFHERSVNPELFGVIAPILVSLAMEINAPEQFFMDAMREYWKAAQHAKNQELN